MFLSLFADNFQCYGRKKCRGEKKRTRVALLYSGVRKMKSFANYKQNRYVSFYHVDPIIVEQRSANINPTL